MPPPEPKDALHSDISLSAGSQVEIHQSELKDAVPSPVSSLQISNLAKMQHPKLNDAAVLTILPERQDHFPLKGRDLPSTPRIEVTDWNAFFGQDKFDEVIKKMGIGVTDWNAFFGQDKFDEVIKKMHPELNAVDSDMRISAGGGVKIHQSELKDAVPLAVSSLQISNLAKMKHLELNDAASLTILPETQDRLSLKAKDLPPTPRIQVPHWNAFFDQDYASCSVWPVKEGLPEEIKKTHPELNDAVFSDIRISAGRGDKIHHPELKKAVPVSNLQISSPAKIKNPKLLNDAGALTIVPETQDQLPLHLKDFPPIPRVEVSKDIDWTSLFDQDCASGGIWSTLGSLKEEANAEDKSGKAADKDA